MAYQHHKTLKSFLILFFSLLAVFTVMSVVYLLGDKNNPNPFGFGTLSSGLVANNSVDITATSGENNPTPELPTCWHVDGVATTTDEHGAYITGYGLFIQQPYEKVDSSNPCPPTYPAITYIEEGVVESGAYKGYNRIIGFRTWDGPGGDVPTPYFFITKDYVTYKIVTHPLLMAPTNIEKSVKSHLAYFQETVNKYKVTGLVDNTKDHIDFPHAPTLKFGPLTYVLTEINTKLSTSSVLLGKTSEGYDIYNDPASTDAHFGPYSTYGGPIDDEVVKAKKPYESLNNYYEGTTKIYVKNTYNIIAEYRLQMKTDKKISTDNMYFEYSLLYGSDIQTKESIYIKYDQVTPTPCGVGRDMYVGKNILDTDIKKIGKTKYGVDIFALINPNHPILKAEYTEKIGRYGTNTQEFIDSNQQSGLKTIPTYEQYVAKNPVLLFKDAWNRWVIVGEFDYMLDGGCGKPVIYLYPKTPTTVHVDFKNVVQLTTDIPSYRYGKGDDKGWNIKAEPNGDLHNLSPAAENIKNCNEYKVSHPGSEYAFDACKQNTYPYIYWAGNTFETYPSMREGFVVRAKDLKKSLEEKLTEIGLTEKEVSDMVEYWYPEMIKKNAPFYRISFMQTSMLNKFIPMVVTPRPDTMIRVFLDWEPLQVSIPLTPQQFIKVPRSGFTYVEWGGLRR